MTGRWTTHGRRARRSGTAVAALAAVAVAGMTLVGGAAGTPRAEAATIPKLKLTQVGKGNEPNGLVARPGTDELIVVEQRGTVRQLGSGRALLDVSDQLSDGNEQGLLGLAFANDGGTAYINLTNRDGDTEIREYAVRNGVLAADTERLLLKVKQPFPNHNGGQLAVDRTGLLWIGLGDGGAAGDPQRNGQNRNALLGKILRIDPRPTAGKPYGIPPTNPFATGKSGRPEIWAYGLRNPWRFSFDVATGSVWIADVGQNQWEEVNVVPANKAGLNFGWNKREGRHAYEGGARPVGAVEPVYEYSHDNGCSVTGGYVYRGKAIPALVGAYVFADYCRGRLLALTAGGGSTWRATSLGLSTSAVTSFGQDAAGNIYVTSGDGPIYRLDPA